MFGKLNDDIGYYSYKSIIPRDCFDYIYIYDLSISFAYVLAPNFKQHFMDCSPLNSY